MRIIDKEITGQDLNELADLYFDRMNRRTKRTDEYFKNSPAGRLKALSGKTNRSKYRKVIQELAENVEHLFVAKPAELVEIHNKLVKIQGNANDLRCKEFKKLIDPVFGYYKRFRNSATRGLVHDWFVALNIATCPYCNRNWISHVDTSGKKDGKFLFDIDHYFPQEKYPYFTLSFYNLIPSCTPCNQRLKKNNELSLNSHIHPFVDDIDGLLKFHIPVTAIS